MKTQNSLLFILLFISVLGFGQTSIFSEDMGAPSGTTTISSNLFQNSGSLAYSNGSQPSSADVRSTSPSSGYSGSSAGGNIFFSATSGAVGFSIETINAANFSSLHLQFGYKKESASSHASFAIEYWNGSSWTSLVNTASDLFNEPSNAPAVWYPSKTIALPAAAQINGLKIRWVKSGTVAIRIDDVRLTGTPTPPTVINNNATAISSESAVFEGTVIATGGTPIISTGSVFSEKLINSDPQLSGVGVTTVITTNPNSGPGSFSNFSQSILLPNTEYSYKAFATRSGGITGYSLPLTFFTLAKVPGAPVIGSITAASITLSIDPNGNPAHTTFALFESNTGTYVQANGSLGSTPVYKTASDWSNTVVLGLSSATTYSFTSRAKNGAGVITAESPVSNATTLTYSSNSDIVLNSTSDTNGYQNLDYQNYQGTTLTNVNVGPNGSKGVFGFYLRDGGASLSDSDSLPTELTQIEIGITNPSNIKAVRLFVGSSPRGVPVIVNGASSVTLTGLTGIIASDNSQLAINLRVTFNSTVSDNEQIQFKILSASANATGSRFAAENAGGAQSVITGDVNRIEVVADRIAFIQHPSNASVGQVMSPSPSVETVDLNGNRDLDFQNNVSLTSSGILSNSVTSNASAGLATFNSVIHTQSGQNLQLSASSTSLTGQTSLPFDITSTATLPEFEQIGPICQGTFLALPSNSENNVTGSWTPSPNNLATTTYTFTPDAGQNATTTTMTVVVSPNTVPIFNQIAPISIGGIVSLPTTSVNGISGTWSPTTDNTTTTTYLFTPAASFGPCASTATMTVYIVDPSGDSTPGVGGISGPFGTQSYHDTQGKLEISNSGAATYTIPIALPPSIQNVGPTINLVYNGGQMGGIAGQGWSIHSISYISRISTRFDLDGFIDGVDFDNNDKLALDGQRLLIKTGQYWADGSTYQTETQSNTKIELFGSGSTRYFVVTAPDGSRSWYGNYGGENAVDETAYYITRFEDTNGNYILYKYFKPYGQSLCINNIRFSANGDTMPQNMIKFNYKQAQRTERTYVGGAAKFRQELLDYVEVFTGSTLTGSTLFRYYQLTHSTDPNLGYQRLIKVQEYNGVGESANPIVLEYDETQTDDGPESESEKSYFNNLDFSDVDLAGDFDGDGRLDFTSKEDQLYIKLFESTNANAPIDFTSEMVSEQKKFTATTIANNRLNQFQSIVLPDKTDYTTEFKVFNLNGSSFTNTYSKIIELPNLATYGDPNSQTFYCTGDCEEEASTHIGLSTNESPYFNACNEDNTPLNVQRYFEGDFNGDGISEVFIVTFQKVRKFNYKHFIGTNGGTMCTMTDETDGVYYHLLDLDPSKSTNLGSSGFVRFYDTYLVNPDKPWLEEYYISDFNGDGKSDILVISRAPDGTSGNYKVIGFKQLTAAPWVELEVLGNGNIDEFTLSGQLFSTKPVLMGDYNGDAKTDIMLPDTHGGEGDNLWHIYFSNPNPNNGSFFVKETHEIVEYRPTTGEDYDTQIHFSNYYPLDVNKDGKTDLVRVWRKKYKPDWTINDHDTQWRVSSFVNNIGNSLITGNKFTLDHNSSNHDNDSPNLPIPIASAFRHNGRNNELVMMREHTDKLTYVKFTKDVERDILIKKITSSAGNIIDEIAYDVLEPSNVNNGLGSLNQLYSSGDSVEYPFVEIKRLPATRVVKKLTNAAVGITKHQDFRYHGFIVNMNGIGAIGFRKNARSAWYVAESEKRIWTVSENSPALRGLVTRSYTQMINNGSGFSFSSATFPTGVINTTTNTYNSSIVDGLFTVSLQSQIVQDHITNVKKETIYSYLLPYYLVENETSKNYLGTTLQGTVNTFTEYQNNPGGGGNSYFIGRPIHTVSTYNAYNDTFQTEEFFHYTGNRLSKTEKTGNNTTGVLTEEYEYFPNGNLKKKTLSAPGAVPPVTPRSTEFTYDASQRFVKTSKDVEGLITENLDFHLVYGLVLKVKSPFGLESSFDYDAWGKTIKETDYLGKHVYYSYTKTDGEYKTQQTNADGSRSITISDALGRVIRQGASNINGVVSFVSTEYDYLNRKKKVSQPYFSTDTPSQWTINTYDEYGRIIEIKEPTNRTSTIAYSGLSATTTTTAGGITIVNAVTKNANDHVVSTSDNGGTVFNSYFANGNIKSSTYDGNTVEIEYDGWGRKTKLTDPSAGIYQYEYNIYGETLKEITPKGTTSYDLSPIGKINFSTLVGNSDPTNTKTTYTYDEVTKLVTAIRFDDFANNTVTSYSYKYDMYNRPTEKMESGPEAVFKQELSYDEFGRAHTEKYFASVAGQQSEKEVQNKYKNGFLWKIVDDATSQILWQYNTVNARGQLISATYGNGTEVTNQFDEYGLPSQFLHQKTGVGNIMLLTTDFNEQRGNLMSRSNSLFGWQENFTYDNLDRLTSYKNDAGQIVNQDYELDGRIKENNLGTYNYINSAKKYQHTSISLNESALPRYKNRAGIFNDDMECRTNWSSDDPLAITFDQNESNSGDTSLKITNTGTTEKTARSAFWIPISNDSPVEYTYSGWVRSDGPQAEIQLYMKSATETGQYTQTDQVIVAAGSTWMHFEKTVLVPANITRLNLVVDNNNGGGSIWIDDIRIHKTSEVIDDAPELNITYNPFKSPVEIEETNVGRLSFEYSHTNFRSVMYYGGLQQNKMDRQFRKYYSDNGIMEVKRDMLTGAVEFTTFIGGDGYTAPLILRSDGMSQEYLYLHRDYQGSILAITNQAGAILEKRLFDAWGKLLRVQDGQGNAYSTLIILDRGYTGHEHLPGVELINMNGRLYDPVVHRFLQPDNFVQDPSNTQNFNRYAYCLNNPLKYTDPSGEITIGLAILIGAAVSALTYTITALTADVPFSAGGLLHSAAIGAFSGAVTFGIGEHCATIANFYSRAGTQALMHGGFQGFMSGIQGGDFFVGFASGCLASIASTLYAGGSSYNSEGAIANSGFKGFGKFAESTVGVLAFGTVSGGAGSALTGGNFWQGAATGLIVSGLNHVAHKLNEANTTVAGIYGAGGEGASGNPELKSLVEGQGGRMFTSSTPFSLINGDDEIIAYLKDGFDRGNKLKLYGHSRGGAAAVRIANKLGAMNITINEMILFDPVALYCGGNFNFDYPNVMKVTNYYQRNPTDHMFSTWEGRLANNPFQGSPVTGSYQWPVIRNVNYTGNLSINHINITNYAINNP